MGATNSNTPGESSLAPVSDDLAPEAMARSLREGNDNARAMLENMGEVQRKAITDAFQRLYGEPFKL